MEEAASDVRSDSFSRPCIITFFHQHYVERIIRKIRFTWLCTSHTDMNLMNSALVAVKLFELDVWRNICYYLNACYLESQRKNNIL